MNLVKLDGIIRVCRGKGGVTMRYCKIAMVVWLSLVCNYAAFGCTVVVAGKGATVDGSVIASQTADGWYDSNIRYVPGKKHGSGESTPIYLNLLGEDDRKPVKIAEIPEVEETYGYFRTGYSSYNEHQLAIAESTIGQKDELKAFYPDTKSIMTVEQLSILALQRTRTARDAIRLIGEMAERYGFLGSCAYEGESLAIADTDEIWILEIMSVGYDWSPDSGCPGAIWAARRVPDDHVAVIANASRIGVVDPDDGEHFMVSENYMDPAVSNGWYDPASNAPFNWTEIYSPGYGPWSPSSMWVRSRLFCIYSDLAPSIRWDPYGELRSYPFSFKPESPVSVSDVFDIFRSRLQDTPFSMEDNQAWLVPGVNGELVKSELATPVPDRATRFLLNIPYSRPIAARTSYSFVAQNRNWLPDPVGGIMWFGMGLPLFSCYVPIYAGVTDTADSWRTFEADFFDPASARWCVSLASDLVNRRYQRAMKDLVLFRNPLEKSFMGSLLLVDKEAVELYERSPEKCSSYLTELTVDRMEGVRDGYWRLCRELIAKYNGNKFW
jgi:dipeptidase